MPNSLRNKIKHLAYKGELTERERDRILNALDREVKWISCSEKLPEKSGDYLVTIKWKGKYSGNIYIETDVIEYDKKTKKWNCGSNDCIIAWMSLLKPYNAESENKK